MFKSGGKYIILLLVVFSMIGCASAQHKEKKISIRGFIQDEPRVDQDISGKVGNWQNAPDAQDPERKMTRKIYYLELTKELDMDDPADKTITTVEETTTESITPAPTVSQSQRTQSTQQTTKSNINLPSFDDSSTQPSTSTGTGKFVDYKVEKDDTLQKISMKFYNSNNKWPKIYEANKDKISNPNFIKPGIVLRVPVE